MSRSYRKPYITDQMNRCTKEDKRKANRRVRLRHDKLLKGLESYELADGKAYRKASNSWDIRDFSFHAPENLKARRK